MMTGKQNSNSTELALETFRGPVTELNAACPSCALAFTAADDNGSYFVASPRPRLSRAEMAKIGQIGLFPFLESIWIANGHEKLLDLLPYLMEIAAAIESEHAAGDDTDDAPAELIYQMY